MTMHIRDITVNYNHEMSEHTVLGQAPRMMVRSPTVEIQIDAILHDAEGGGRHGGVT